MYLFQEMVPDIDVDKFRKTLMSYKDSFKGKIGEIEMDPKFKDAGWEKYNEFRTWFNNRLDNAIQKVEELVV